MQEHKPVLIKEVVDFFEPVLGGVLIDGTLGLGGHASALFERARELKKQPQILGIEQDKVALNLAKERLKEQITYLEGNFADVKELLKEHGIVQVDGILLDIGVSSLQLDSPERGFSFMHDGPLDMRMNQNQDLTAADIANNWREADLVKLLFEFGEERFARRIAKRIVEERKKTPFQSTQQLAELLIDSYPVSLRHKRPHPATRTFQALRIAVNDELGVLQEGIEAALSLLAPKGRLIIITFHSLEDRIVKHRFRTAVETGDYALLNKKPILPSEDEQRENPRSRSAKLRGIARVN